MAGIKSGLIIVVAAAGFAILASGASSAKPDPDGRYEGKATNQGSNPLDQVEIDFKVAGNGKKIKKWIVGMNVVCGLDVRYVAQSMPTMRVKRNGRFHKVFKRTFNGTRGRIEVAGKLRGRRVKGGTLSYRVGTCARGEGANPIRWKAKRIRR